MLKAVQGTSARFWSQIVLWIQLVQANVSIILTLFMKSLSLNTFIFITTESMHLIWHWTMHSLCSLNVIVQCCNLHVAATAVYPHYIHVCLRWLRSGTIRRPCKQTLGFQTSKIKVDSILYTSFRLGLGRMENPRTTEKLWCVCLSGGTEDYWFCKCVCVCCLTVCVFEGGADTHTHTHPGMQAIAVATAMAI